MGERLRRIITVRRLLILLVVLVLGIAVTLALLIVIPVRASGEEGKAIADELKAEYRDLAEVEFSEDIVDPSGRKYRVYDFKDSHGNEAGFAEIDTVTGEICSVFHADLKRIPNHMISVEDAKEAAKEYCETWRKGIPSDYVLIKEDLHCDWVDGKNNSFQRYQLEWKKCIGEVLLPDYIYVEVDAGSGEIIYWHKYDSNISLPGSPEELSPRISEDDALKIAGEAIPSPQDWSDQAAGACTLVEETEVKVSRESSLNYLNFDQDGQRLVWIINIEYDKVAKRVQPNDMGIEKGYSIDGRAFYLTVDALSGEVLDVEHSL